MPRQNRVTPLGEIVAIPDRGAWLGNRGILHDENGRLGKARWRHRAWIICRLQFKNRHRQVMTPRRWTELFFMDEATALAAGHRPCCECRREDFKLYCSSVASAFGGTPPRAPMLDRQLHLDRLSGGKQRSVRLPIREVPDGAILRQGGDPSVWLRWHEGLHRWTASGYDRHRELPLADVEVLTPALTLIALRCGYRPQINASAMHQA